jgi:uncharacterized membrane protein YeaQ/YmgE (transglycosylase-associated protein family)
MSIFVWVMMGIAVWHAAVLLPDRFYGGIIGAFVAAVAGACLAGYLLPVPGLSGRNPPGLAESLWPVPGALLALAAAYAYGSYRERLDPERA